MANSISFLRRLTGWVVMGWRWAIHLESIDGNAGGVLTMAVELPLAQMSLDDKLQAMELLWADLSKDPSQVVSPAWHGDLLRSRREQAKQGKANFQSWESAMGDLRAELHGHQAP
jgi:hypothetical protein